MNYLFFDKLIPQKVMKFQKGCVIPQNNLCANMKNINKLHVVAKVDGGLEHIVTWAYGLFTRVSALC